MKELPILFSTEMVKALLDGRKTMTRRVMNPQPLKADIDKVPTNGWASVLPLCPYGQPGDILWVRESFCLSVLHGTHVPKDDWDIYAFKADDHKLKGWKPSIHMPKAAARIWLLVEEVRITRLQNITEEDAMAEGVEQNRDGSWHDYLDPLNLWQDTARASFNSLWCSIKGEYSWYDEPWVWVVKFKVVSTIGKPVAFSSGEGGQRPDEVFPTFPPKQPAYIR